MVQLKFFLTLKNILLYESLQKLIQSKAFRGITVQSLKENVGSEKVKQTKLNEILDNEKFQNYIENSLFFAKLDNTVSGRTIL